MIEQDLLIINQSSVTICLCLRCSFGGGGGGLYATVMCMVQLQLQASMHGPRGRLGKIKANQTTW